MNKLFQLFIIGLLVINSVFTYKSMNMMTKMKESMAFDIDKAREQYRKDVKYFYTAGCRTGTEYVPETENGAPVFGFNKNPTYYCNSETLKNEQELTDNLYTLGRQVR